MPDTTYQPKVYKKDGGDTLVVADGGKIEIEPGGAIEGEGDALVAATFDEDYFAVTENEVTLTAAVAKGAAVANIPAVPTNLSDSANGAAIAAAVNGNAAAINSIIAALEEFGISLPD